MRLFVLLLLIGLIGETGFAAEPPVKLQTTIGQPVPGKSGQPLRLPVTLELTNNGTSDLILNFNNGQRFDFFLLTDKGEEVTRWSDGRAFVMMIGHMKLSPGETKRFSDHLRLEKEGQPVPAGDYLVEGIVASNPPLKADRVKLHLN